MVRLQPDARGRCTFRVTTFATSNRVDITLTSRRYQKPRTRVFRVSEDGRVHVDLALTTEASAHVKVRIPKDGHHYISLERWDSRIHDWTVGRTRDRGMPTEVADAEGFVLFRDLPEGRYRAVDTVSLTASDPFEVSEGSDPAQATLDLSACDWARGVVIVPKGASLDAVKIIREDTVLLPAHSATGFTEPIPYRRSHRLRFNRTTGVFRCRVPTGRSVELSVRHPWHKPHPTFGTIVIDKPRSDYRLQLTRESGALVTFARPIPDPDAGTDANSSTGSYGMRKHYNYRVVLTAVDGRRNECRAYLNAARDAIEFGEYEPGRYTLAIDTVHTAPVLVENVRLKAVATAIGPVSWSRGSRYRVKFIYANSGKKSSHWTYFLTLRANPTSPMHFRRTAELNKDGGEIVGLAAGRYHIEFAAKVAPGLSYRKSIDFDGTNDVEHEIKIE